MSRIGYVQSLTPQVVADMPGYGSGKRYRDMLAAAQEARAALPKADEVGAVYASASLDVNATLLASFGCGDEDDWHLLALPARVMDHNEYNMGLDAGDDCRAVAAIVNAYRLGLLVLREGTE